MICKKRCSQKRKYKGTLLKGVYRAGGICIGSARRFEVKKGIAPAVSSAIMQKCGLKAEIPSQPALFVDGFSLYCLVMSKGQNRAIMTR